MVRFLLLLVYGCCTVFPLVYLALSSVRTGKELFLRPFGLPHAPLAWENYTSAWTVGHLGDAFGTSVVVTLTTVVLVTLLGAMAAYALARLVFRQASAVQMFFVGGLMVPLQMAVIPLFFELGWLHLLNSRLGLILVYTASGLPFTIFVLIGFFRTLPGELLEAATIDGCGPFRAFWSVMLPLARPGLLTTAVFTFLGTWNEYFLAFMFLSGKGAPRTLPLGLANLTIVSQYRTDYGSLYAGLVIVMLPTLLVYLLLQRYITKGVTAGAVKG